MRAIYGATGEWTVKEGWEDHGQNHCEFYGVTCDDNENVVKIILPNNALIGNIPDSIWDLDYLKELDLRDNDVKLDFGTLLTVRRHD